MTRRADWCGCGLMWLLDWQWALLDDHGVRHQREGGCWPVNLT